MTADAGVISFSSNRCEPGVEETVADWGPMGCRSGIWLIDDDGTDLRNLTGGDNTPNEDDVTEEGPIGVAVVGLSGPAISPDGKHFVATKNILPAGQPRLFTTDLTGGGQRLLSPPLAPDACPPEPQWCAAEYNLQDEQPDWSPNGRTVVFVSNRADFGFGRPHDLYVLDVPTGDLRRLTYTPDLVEEQPTFSPDGSRIVFDVQSVDPTTPERSGVFSMKPDGSDWARLTTSGLGSGGAYSPDGSRLAIAAFDRGIFTLAVDGSDLRPVFGSELGLHPSYDSVVWAGSHAIVFTAMKHGIEKSPALFEVTLDGRGAFAGVQQLTDLGHNDSAPDWAPEGERPEPIEEDHSAPAVVLYDAKSGQMTGQTTTAAGARTAAQRAPRFRVSKSVLRLAAVDGTGLGRVQVSLSTAQNEGRCIYTKRVGLSRPRNCERPRYFRATPIEWSKLMQAIEPGRYRVWLRGRDIHGNVTPDPSVTRLRLLP
jgi:Tol biopolymer transport system component